MSCDNGAPNCLITTIGGSPINFYCGLPSRPLAPMPSGPKAPSHSLMLKLYIYVNHAQTSHFYLSILPLCPLAPFNIPKDPPPPKFMVIEHLEAII